MRWWENEYFAKYRAQFLTEKEDCQCEDDCRVSQYKLPCTDFNFKSIVQGINYQIEKSQFLLDLSKKCDIIYSGFQQSYFGYMVSDRIKYKESLALLWIYLGLDEGIQ